MMGISEGLSRMRWKLSRTVLRGGVTGNGGSLLGSHDGKKVPYYVSAADGSPLAFAGIWDGWKAPDGSLVESFSILTTSANSMVATIHDRMPVILHHQEYALWLDRKTTDPGQLTHLYQPYPTDLLRAWPVSTIVNSVRNDTPACIEQAPESRAG